MASGGFTVQVPLAQVTCPVCPNPLGPSHLSLSFKSTPVDPNHFFRFAHLTFLKKLPIYVICRNRFLSSPVDSNRFSDNFSIKFDTFKGLVKIVFSRPLSVQMHFGSGTFVGSVLPLIQSIRRRKSLWIDPCRAKSLSDRIMLVKKMKKLIKTLYRRNRSGSTPVEPNTLLRPHFH